jgi:hypothetical protein
MTNITYAQVETLLKKYTTLKASWKAWHLSYMTKATEIMANPEEGLFTEEEILLTQFIGNHILSDMPHGSPNPGDKLINVILAKDKIMEEALEEKINLTLKGLKAPIIRVGTVIMRIDFAMECLSVQERVFIEKFYFKDMPWKAILESTEYYIEEKRAREVKRGAVLKIVSQLQDPKALVTMEDFEFCMKELGRKEKE